MATSPQVFVLVAGGPSPARAIAWAQAQLLAAVNRALQEPAAALTLGVAFGIHETLSADVRAPLQDAGLIHIVVVSGLKVVLIIGLISAVARAFEWSRRRTLPVALPVVAAYVLISGAGPAAIRSALMAGAAMLAATGATAHRSRSHARAGGGTDARCRSSRWSRTRVSTLVSRHGRDPAARGPIAARLPGPRLIGRAVRVTVAAQLATVPVMAGTFGVISLAGPSPTRWCCRCSP